MTFLRGELITEDGEVVGEPGAASTSTGNVPTGDRTDSEYDADAVRVTRRLDNVLFR